MPLDVPEKDLVRLLHMRDAAREALRFKANRQRADLDGDRMFFRAVVSCIQEIGEAAVKVTGPRPASSAARRPRPPHPSPRRDQLPGVARRPIISMRNRIVHAYFDVRPDLVWQVLEQDLQPLLDELEPVLPEGT